MTPKNIAASATVRASGPLCTRCVQAFVAGQNGTRPKVPLKPTTPVRPAGIRIDPAPSPPCASGPRPAATAAAAPPEEPPGVVEVSHGFTAVGATKLSHMSL
jgi:hypothetical protein